MAPQMAPAAPESLVIEGATLIDGTGAVALQDSSVVIEGNRIAAVGAKGRVSHPNGARILDGRDKFIVPGLIDSKANYASSFGEAYLMWGVTSAVVSGGSGDAGLAERDAIDRGLFVGPRLLVSFASITGARVDAKLAPPIPGSYQYPVRTPAEARDLAIKFLDAGADLIAASSAQGTADLFSVVVEEAHRRGKAAVLHTGGLYVRGQDAAPLGFDVLIHGGHLGNALAKDSGKWKDYVDRRPDPYADMDEGKVAATLQLLLRHNVTLEPDLMAMGRGCPKAWARAQAENASFYSDAALRSYMPEFQQRAIIENVKAPETYLSERELVVRKSGFRNYVRLLKAYVDAGGRVVAASDVPETPPGLGVHQEMAVLQEDAGFTPMQALQSATQWAAAAWRLPDRGVIAPGKLADLVIVDADPTVDILNLRRISAVIKNGRLHERRYHADYLQKTFKMGMFESGACCFSSPVVEGIGFTGTWVAALKQATWRPEVRNGDAVHTGGFDSELAPTPAIEAITPYVLPAGSEATELVVTGFNFVRGSQVYVDEQPVPTRAISRTEVRATLSASLLSSSGRPVVRVKNPPPLGTSDWGDRSNAAKLVIIHTFTTRSSGNRF
jgi:imidazolonepropionase-like amidohydrolase